METVETLRQTGGGSLWLTIIITNKLGWENTLCLKIFGIDSSTTADRLVNRGGSRLFVFKTYFKTTLSNLESSVSSVISDKKVSCDVREGQNVHRGTSVM